jgi:hypothetical protein
MDVQEILSHLQRSGDHFPRGAIREAVDRREDPIPPLREVLADAAHDPQPFASDPDRMIQIYAMFPLAQFRGTRAYPLLVQIFSSHENCLSIWPVMSSPRIWEVFPLPFQTLTPPACFSREKRAGK